MLRKAFGPKTNDVTAWWKRLHVEKPYDLYSSDIIRLITSGSIGWAGHVACTEEMRGAYRNLVRGSEGKRPLERLRREWKYNIKMYFQ